jgi:hypothetical protein
MTNNASVFARIIKTDKQSDGTLMVTGIATDDTVDVDEQICDPEWLKSAMPEWFSWGNIREQHSNIAAGVATEYEAVGTQHIITARVVDPASVKKVENGVLKGFSIGIRNPRVIKDEKAIGGRIVDGQIVEVSLVDRPANPTCVLTMAKAVDGLLKSVEGNMMSEVIKAAEESTEESTEMTAEATMEMKAVEESTEGSNPAEESTEESTEVKAMEESTMSKEAMCKECGKAESECKCAEGGFERKAVEESSQAEGEESSQEIGEESSREGGIAGVAGKSIEAITEQLTRIEKSLTLMNETYGELLKGVSTTEDIAKSVQEVTERLSVVEKSPASSAPVRMAVINKAQTVNPDIAKASEYRAKAMATTDRKLADGYLALAAELETNL